MKEPSTPKIKNISEHTKLSDLESRLNLLMINTEENFVLIDRDLNIVNFNHQFRKQYQILFHKDVIKGESILNYAQKDRIEIVKNIYNRVFSGERVESEIQAPLQDKKVVIIHNLFKPAFDENGIIIGAFVSSKDITEQRNAEERRRESEADLRAIFDNSSEGLMLLDHNGVIKAFNAKSAENHMLYNVNDDLEIGRKLIEYINDSRKEYFQDILNKVLSGETINYDIDYDQKDGSKKWFHATLNPIFEGKVITGICLTRSDISERKIAEEKLKKGHEILFKLTQNVPAAIYRFEMDGDGKMSFPFISKGIESMVPNITVEQIMNDAANAFNAVHPEDLPNLINSIMESRKNLSDWNLEYRIISEDKLVRWLKGSSRPEKIENRKENDTVVWHGYLEDITERKKSELKLQNLLNISSDQNKRLQNFAYIVSHNIRSHSSNIIGLVDIIGQAGETNNKAKFYEMLKTSTDKLGETIENLNEIITVQNELNIIQAGINLKEEITKTSNAINALLSQSNTQLFNKVPESCIVQVVPSYLESILLNLLTNAIKYKSPERDPIINIYTESTDNQLILSIEDNGLGIDMEKHGKKLFGMYKTFHNNKDARGFGLFITKNQIEAMDGKIEVISQLGIGSTFKIYFKREIS